MAQGRKYGALSKNRNSDRIPGKVRWLYMCSLCKLIAVMINIC